MYSTGFLTLWLLGPLAEDYLDKISKISKDANRIAAKQTVEIDGESNCL